MYLIKRSTRLLFGIIHLIGSQAPRSVARLRRVLDRPEMCPMVRLVIVDNCTYIETTYEIFHTVFEYLQHAEWHIQMLEVCTRIRPMARCSNAQSRIHRATSSRCRTMLHLHWTRRTGALNQIRRSAPCN
jgi:hypothetical protein